jgi:colanic acid biosynthesis glycosyl transferase WcaI
VNIGYLIQDFPPEVGAGPARALEMSRHWQSHGARVTVMTAMPNRRIPGRGDGTIAGAYRRRLFVEETFAGIRTMRSWLYTSARRGFAKTVLNNATFTATSFAHGVVRRPDIDVLIASSPPFLPLISGVGLSVALGVPLVIELRDLWPDYLEQMGMIRSRRMRSALFALERWLLARADRVVVVTESFRARVIAKGVAPERVHVIPNGVDLQEYRASDEASPLPALRRGSGEFLVGYLGTFGRGQGLVSVIEAAARVKTADPGIRFVLVGDGAEKPAVEEAIVRLEATNVTVLPPVSRDQTRAFYNSCDVCLVPLAPIPIFAETIPSKIFEVMACERPVIATVLGEAARIMAASGGGLRADPGDAVGLADSIIAMRHESVERRREMGVAGRRYVAEHYDRAALSGRYLDILRSATTSA